MEVQNDAKVRFGSDVHAYDKTPQSTTITGMIVPKSELKKKTREKYKIKKSQGRGIEEREVRCEAPELVLPGYPQMFDKFSLVRKYKRYRAGGKCGGVLTWKGPTGKEDEIRTRTVHRKRREKRRAPPAGGGS